MRVGILSGMQAERMGWVPLDGMGARRVQSAAGQWGRLVRYWAYEVISSVHLSFGASRGRVAVSAGYPSVQTRGKRHCGPHRRAFDESV